jgi:hypothetical protein
MHSTLPDSELHKKHRTGLRYNSMIVLAVVLVPFLLMAFAFSMERIESSLLREPNIPETPAELAVASSGATV